MPLILTYLLKLSLSLGVVFLFYQLVLRKLTFYNWNRWYLLGYTLLSFVISFVDISPVLERNEWTRINAVNWVPVIGEYRIIESHDSGSAFVFNSWNIAVLLLFAGMLIMLFRLLFQLISFRRMMKRAKYIPGEGMKLYQLDEDIIPFSFGNSIFINQRLHTPEELQEIIRHEFVHVKQKHSIDIIWGECLCMINWYNPFAWLLKRSIRQNLEFIADNKVLGSGIDKKQYQYLLLRVIGNNQYSIAQKFNFSSLKKRIAMMNKLKTARLHLVRFLFILPLLAVVLLSFRKQIGNSFTGNEKNGTTDTIPRKSLRESGPPSHVLNDKNYFITIRGEKGNCTVVVKDKAGKEVESVLLTDWNEKQAYYENLYGDIYPLEVPLPPGAPFPPGGPTALYFAVPSIDEDDPGVKAFLKRNPDVKSVGWAHENNKGALQVYFRVTKKDGTTEVYNMNDEAEKSKAVKKYGELPLPPPPPPPPLPSNGVGSLELIDDEITIAGPGDSEVELVRAVLAARPDGLVSTGPLELATPICPEVIAIPSLSQANEFESLAVAGVDGYISGGKEKIVITISKNSTRQQLEEFKKQAKEKGIELEYGEIEYNNKNILTRISGKMKSKDTQGSFSAYDFDQLVLSIIEKEGHTYFRVDEKIKKPSGNKEVI